MNKLKGHFCYLIGNMDGVSFDAAFSWRQRMSKFLKAKNVLVLDPIDKAVDVFLEDEDFRKKRKEALLKNDFDQVAEMMKPTRSLDLRCVDKADFLVCNLDMSGRPFGSTEEITTANRQKKPIIIHCPQGKADLPPWLFAMTPHELFFNKWEEVESYLDKIDSGEDIRTWDRWWYWNWDKLIEGTSL